MHENRAQACAPLKLLATGPKPELRLAGVTRSMDMMVPGIIIAQLCYWTQAGLISHSPTHGSSRTLGRDLGTTKPGVCMQNMKLRLETGSASGSPSKFSMGGHKGFL